MFKQGGGDDRFIFRGIEGAGRVDQSAAGFEHVDGAFEDTKLKGVKRVAVGDTPLGPNLHILTKRAVTATGHVGEDSVELEILPVLQLDSGEHGGVKVGDH